MTTTTDSNFVQPAIPKLGEHYDHWAMLMENFLRSKEYWNLIDPGIPQQAAGVVLTENEKKALEELKLKDLKAKNYLFQAIDRTVLETILKKGTSKEIWDSLKKKYQGTARVKRAQLQALRRDWEILQMKNGDSVNDYFARTLTIANKMRMYGEQMSDLTVIEKILRSMTSRYDYVVCSIEESHDLDSMTVDELQSSLLVHEQRMNGHNSHEEQVLKVAQDETSASRGRGRSGFRGGPSRGRGRGRGGRQLVDKAAVECYHCHEYGHFQYECPKKPLNSAANYAETGEEAVLLMAQLSSDGKSNTQDMWFIDSGCSNHMTGRKDWFSSIDASFRDEVKLGNNYALKVNGKGIVKLIINGVVHLVNDVFYVPELKNNLLSVGQLLERGLTVEMKQNKCSVFKEKSLIFETFMTTNRMFAISVESGVSQPCFQVSSMSSAQVWHSRYGHLSYSGLKTLLEHDMVKGMPSFNPSTQLCEHCLKGKHQRDPFPRQSNWRASQLLQLIHSDICGPINPTSNGHKSEHGIQRQLTASYTPQQNGVAERKNKTIINMVRSVLVEKGVPRSFWPEAVKWVIHILNRSPTLAVKNVTPEEAWSGIKPSVSYFRIFGCIGYVHVPDQKRSKLDDKSVKCVLLGVSEESKAYKLYDPIKKKILISRDVKFQEDAAWDWGETKTSITLDTNELNPMEESCEEAEEITQDNSNDTAAATTSTISPNSTSNVFDSSISGASETPAEGRARNPPAWMRDYVTGDDLTEEDAINFAMFAGADPVTYKQASKIQHWRDAMDAEIHAIQKNDTWELIDPPSDCKVVGVKWIFKTKLKETGEIDKFKARLVAKGYTQEEGIDYSEIFAPVARLETIRTVVALAATKRWSIHQLDIKSAFLHGAIKENVYLEQPPGYVLQGREHQVYKLKKALYGLKQAPRAWYSKLESHLAANDFLKCPDEHTLFMKKKDKGEILIVCVYVDDLIYTGNDDLMFQEFKTMMMKEFAMTDLGKMRYFLGIEVLQGCNGIFIGQKKYVKDVLNKFGMSDCNPVNNPIIPGNRLLKSDKGAEVDTTQFKQLVGSLMYLTATRPDIAYSVSLISRFMENPKESHFLAAKRILRYLQGTQNLGIFYRAEGNEELIAYTDSDYARDLDDRKSTSGYAFLLGGGVISWVSKKQPVVSLSTTEAEFIAAALCACQCVWLRRILGHLNHYQKGATVMFCDNASTIKLSKNPVLHGRSKHIDVRFHFLRNLCNDGVIELNYCSTRDQLADIMTKPLKVEEFQHLLSALGMLDESEINCCKEHAV